MAFPAGAPQSCPSCGTALVARVHGPWCPRCRDWIVLKMFPGANSLAPRYQWRVSGR